MALNFHSNVSLTGKLQQESQVWLEYAYYIAGLSPDKSNQCGAVLLDHNGWEVSVGYNHFPESVVNKYGIDYLLEDRDRKLFYIEHAERNAIYNGLGRTDEGVLVCPWFACSDCARAIMLSGVKLVIGHKQRMELTPERWEKSIEAALDMLDTHGVKMYFYDGECKAHVIVNGNFHATI